MNMTRKYRRILLIGIFLVGNALIIYGISQIIGYFNSGAERASIFQRQNSRTNYYAPDTQWTASENPGRELDAFNREAIEKDYLDAWYVRHLAFDNNDHSLLDDYYTESAKENLTAFIEYNKQESIYTESTTLSHSLELELFSSDGKVIIFKDHDVRLYTRYFQNGDLIGSQNETATFKVVMLLEDGFWRIRHIEKLTTAAGKTNNSSKSTTHNLPKAEGFNYYPQSHPWNTFSDEINWMAVENDFKEIKNLNLNTLRIFIGYEDFGKADVSITKLNRLTQFLDLAHQYDIQAIITLFDFYGDYSVIDWSLSETHAKTIVSQLKDHPAIYAWDIKNEPDLDFEARGKKLVMAWLENMIRCVRKTDASTPITIGWSSPKSALYLENDIDIVSFHYYEAIKDLREGIRKIGEKTTKPIFIQELGMSTYSGIWNPFGYSEDDQEAYYRSFYDEQWDGQVNYLFWTLYDFKKIPDNVAGNFPWRKNKQAHFGIINEEGTHKPAYAIIKNR